MCDEHLRLKAIAVSLRMRVETARRQHKIECVFHSFADSVRFRTVAFGELDPGIYRHTHRFNDGVVWERWMLTAERFLQDHEVQYRIEMSAGKRVFVFQDPYAHTVFVEMVIQGVFDHAARLADMEAEERYQQVIQKVALEIRYD